MKSYTRLFLRSLHITVGADEEKLRWPHRVVRGPGMITSPWSAERSQAQAVARCWL